MNACINPTITVHALSFCTLKRHNNSIFTKWRFTLRTTLFWKALLSYTPAFQFPWAKVRQKGPAASGVPTGPQRSSTCPRTLRCCPRGDAAGPRVPSRRDGKVCPCLERKTWRRPCLDAQSDPHQSKWIKRVTKYTATRSCTVHLQWQNYWLIDWRIERIEWLINLSMGN